ncbi:hypothetical protein GYB22_09915 [bacterium]|nr:hypothetical protein [bacterium]
MMKFLTTALMLLPTLVFAQRGLQYPYWSAKITASPSFFLSDLGGKNAVGTNDPSDLDLSETSIAVGFGLHYNAGAFGIGANALYARLKADDANTQALRSIRQLSVFTDIVETNVIVELTVPQRVPVLGNFYVNFGGGFVYYQPKAELNGVVYKLRYLGTEGQLYLPGKSPYSLFSPVIPFGFGKKIPMANGTRLCLDVSLRKTFTDYLDDVSTVYADPARIAEQAGPAAAALADRSVDGRAVGSRRGDRSDMDNYFMIGFRYEVPLTVFARDFNTTCAFATGWTNYKSASPRKFNRRGRARGRR